MTVKPKYIEVTAREMMLFIGPNRVLVDWNRPEAHRAALAELERERKRD